MQHRPFSERFRSGGRSPCAGSAPERAVCWWIPSQGHPMRRPERRNPGGGKGWELRFDVKRGGRRRLQTRSGGRLRCRSARFILCPVVVAQSRWRQCVELRHMPHRPISGRIKQFAPWYGSDLSGLERRSQPWEIVGLDGRLTFAVNWKRRFSVVRHAACQSQILRTVAALFGESLYWTCHQHGEFRARRVVAHGACDLCFFTSQCDASAMPWQACCSTKAPCRDLVDTHYVSAIPASAARSLMNGRPVSMTSSGRSATGRHIARPDAISGAR